jgi:hypothetical protein
VRGCEQRCEGASKGARVRAKVQGFLWPPLAFARLRAKVRGYEQREQRLTPNGLLIGQSFVFVKNKFDALLASLAFATLASSCLLLPSLAFARLRAKVRGCEQRCEGASKGARLRAEGEKGARRTKE